MAERGSIQAPRSAKHGFTFSRRSAEHGFTLIELMVALAVFALAAMALIRLEGQVIRTTATLEQTVVAQMVARNVAIEALTDARAPANGLASGIAANGGRDWRWTRDVTPIGDRGALRITVSVADQSGTGIGHLTVVRPPATARPVTP